MHGLRKMERALVFVSLFALLWILASCKNAKEDTPLNLQRASEERGTAESQEASQGIDLVRDLVLGDTEEGFFAEITDVAVDRHGRIYIADRPSYQVKIFSATGQSIMTLGSKGQGPEEFASLASIHIGRGDTLFAYDSRPRRMSVFATEASPQFAYSLSLVGRSGVMRALFGPVAGGYLVGYMDERAIDPAQNPQHIYRTNYQGEVSGQALMSIPQRPLVWQRTGSMVSMTTLPFGRKPVIRFGPERQYVYYGWSDSLSIGIYALDGREVKRIKAAYQPVEVTREDLEQKLGSVDDEPYRTMQRNAEIPDTWPAFNDFIVDDEARVWVNINTADHDQFTWWILETDGTRVATFTLPNEVTFHTVRDGYAYASTFNEAGVPLVVRYRYRITQP